MNRIIEATCSRSLQKAIKKAKFKVSDFDLLILAYRHAPDYDTRIELLRLLAAKTKDAETKMQAKRCIAFEKAKWDRFISDEDDCIFEVKIKDKPDAWEERYIARTFESALRKIRNFCAHYEIVFTEQSRFDIVKRRFTDETCSEDFEEDWRGEASYKGDFVLMQVLHKTLDEREFLVDCRENSCLDCTQPSCFEYAAPRLPRFLKNTDIVCYRGYDGIMEYGVFFGDMRTDLADDCAYLVSLCNDSFCGMQIKMKEQFYELLFHLHCHIPFPKLEVIKAAELPETLKNNYRAFRRLYARFGGE
ncbi:MAG: hypothetical protein FWF10_02500 [Clostridiales bacterium]|nr:hypothetical protein [Clostridiales bacterium]